MKKKDVQKETTYFGILPKRKYILHLFMIAIIFTLLFFTMLFLENNKDEIDITSRLVCLNVLAWVGEYLIIKAITKKTKLSLAIVIIFEAGFDIINYFVRTIRGAAITISDISAIKTAISVAGNANITVDYKFWVGLIFIIAIILILIILRKKFVERKITNIESFFKLVYGVIIILAISRVSESVSLWDINNNYKVDGTQVTIIRMLQDIVVKKPEGYNKQETKNILENYKNSSTSTLENDDKPNIIVIANESFCDYYNLYKDGNADSIESFTKLAQEENVISGTIYTSEYGGQTSNVEYEFLTQNSLRILPVGSYMFQQYITDYIDDSIVTNLKRQGYKTSSIHPWDSYAYSRNKIYKLFGFDESKFREDIDDLELNFNNEFYSDRSTYKELMRQIENKKEDEKLFEYVLTVQNHISFTNPDPNQITYNDNNAKNVYMQLIHESSEAFIEILDKLKDSDEKYIVLFFGDHQPNLDEQDNNNERTLEKYEVPFVIWANYDIEGKKNVKTSMIYLQNYLLNAAGVELSEMNNYMEELRKEYPVITKRFYIDKHGSIHRTDEETPSKLQEYNKIVYYRIFDSNK